MLHLRYFIIVLGILLSILPASITFARDLPELPELPVLLYHRVLPELGPNDSPIMVVSTDKFSADLAYLRDNGYTPLTSAQLLAALEDPLALLPDKPVLITFDDGYMDNYEHAFPLLQEYETPAIMFIIGWSVGRDTMITSRRPITPHFTWDQAQEMLDSGLVEFGSHTFDLHNPPGFSYGYHRPVGHGVGPLDNERRDHAYYRRLYYDLERSRDLIERNLDVPVTTFAYPYGVHSDIAVQVLRDLGFKMAFITESSEPHSSPYLLKRIIVSNDVRLEDLLAGDD